LKDEGTISPTFQQIFDRLENALNHSGVNKLSHSRAKGTQTTKRLSYGITKIKSKNF
jgi:hypothetical protein